MKLSKKKFASCPSGADSFQVYTSIRFYQICESFRDVARCQKSERILEKPLDLVHSDVGEAMNTRTAGGGRYYVTFIDDFSSYTFTFILKSKDEVYPPFCKYQEKVEPVQERKIKEVQLDNGGEYIGRNMKEHFGERIKTTVAHTQEATEARPQLTSSLHNTSEYYI